MGHTPCHRVGIIVQTVDQTPDWERAVPDESDEQPRGDLNHGEERGVNLERGTVNGNRYPRRNRTKPTHFIVNALSRSRSVDPPGIQDAVSGARMQNDMSPWG